MNKPSFEPKKKDPLDYPVFVPTKQVVVNQPMYQPMYQPKNK